MENQLALEKFNEGETGEAFLTRIKNLRDLMAGAGIKKSSEDLMLKRCASDGNLYAPLKSFTSKQEHFSVLEKREEPLKSGALL